MAKVERFGSFADLPELWRAFATDRAATFDQTLPWYAEFERHLLERGQRLHIVGISDERGSPLALLPLRTDQVVLAGPLRVKALTALSNYYTALFAPTSVERHDAQIARVLAHAVNEIDRSSLIDLNPIAAESPFSAEIASEWQRMGYLVERYFRFGNWYLDVAGRSSEQYLSGLPGKLRSTLQRKGKKLLSRPDVVIRIVTEPADVPDAMQGYEAVYRSSWKVDEPHKQFIRDVALAFAQRNGLRLGLVEIDSKPAAAQIWFVHRKTASIFKLAYDQAYADLSVGSLLTMSLMRHVIDIDSVETVDYLCGDDAYKRDWMSARRDRIGLRAVRRRSGAGMVVGAAGLARRITGRDRKKICDTPSGSGPV